MTAEHADEQDRKAREWAASHEYDPANDPTPNVATTEPGAPVFDATTEPGVPPQSEPGGSDAPPAVDDDTEADDGEADSESTEGAS